MEEGLEDWPLLALLAAFPSPAPIFTFSCLEGHSVLAYV